MHCVQELFVKGQSLTIVFIGAYKEEVALKYKYDFMRKNGFETLTMFLFQAYFSSNLKRRVNIRNRKYHLSKWQHKVHVSL